MAICGCCASSDKGEVFKPRNKRWCTDVLCLIFLFIASGAMLAIGYVCVSAHPGLIDGLIYPTDGYGNYCGKPGTDTEKMPKVFYPDLDNDIVKHADKLAKQPPHVEGAPQLLGAPQLWPSARAAASRVAQPRSSFGPARQQFPDPSPYCLPKQAAVPDLPRQRHTRLRTQLPGGRLAQRAVDLRRQRLPKYG